MVSGFLNKQYQRFYTENNITLFLGMGILN